MNITLDRILDIVQIIICTILVITIIIDIKERKNNGK